MSPKAGKFGSDSFLDHDPETSAPSAPTSPTATDDDPIFAAPPPPGSGDLDDSGQIVPPIMTPKGPRHPMEVPVRNPMAPESQRPLDEDDEDEPLQAEPQPKPDPVASPTVETAGAYLDFRTPAAEFMPLVPQATEQKRAEDDPVNMRCSRCGMPYGTFITDPFTGKLVHRYITACTDNMQRPNAFPDITTRVDVLELPS